MSELIENHLEYGKQWNQEIYLSLKRRTKLAWVVAGTSLATALLSATALIIVMPLKEPVPYVITVDRQSGYLEIAQTLKDSQLAKQDAVRDYDIARYVTSRESYNASILAENYEKVQSLSEANAAKDFKILWDDQNPLNPSTILDWNGTIEIQIHSVMPLNEKTASVRFRRILKQNGNITESGNFTAILTYRYSNQKQTNQERLMNPLGFKVSSYSVTEEIGQ